MDRQATGRSSGGQPPVNLSPIFTLDTHLEAGPGQGRAGCALGAQVATMEGLLPVEYLSLGDRIITRSGARVLRGISSVPLISNLVRVAPGALGHDRPGKALVLGAGTEVLVRDWRAQVLFGADQALVPVARLVDGQFITRVTGQKTRLFTLHFDASEVIYADGVEIGCKPLAVKV
ncbi:Hint domain-containing protein [Rhodobacter aestuarii]|uniref:Hint domain-containing protein n=1 Tax=Rhodobacter aestuarii TaxID=453582 RepID=A0A1N7J5C3_9RHOB|nr:Hint domain-containing protein [Rhodobacter aestuarii]PTV97161.1 Hint domain-containing protein [Rhodobacter aestuarii]SIS44563.1 Hint domain-containing protein [Rhodobacter aestuarii]